MAHFTSKTASPSARTWMKAAASALLLVVIGATYSGAQASPVCGSRHDLLQQLSKQYKEEPVALGLSASGSLIEVLTSESGSTWTLMVSQPNGPSCLVAAGESWEELKRSAMAGPGA